MRYLPLTEPEKSRILALCGVKSFDALVEQIPAELRLKKLLDLEPALSEQELHAHLGELAEKNKAASMISFLGQGAYDHGWPSVIDQITNRGEFLTAYTPYQPEVSQGTLQVIFEFQSMIADLMGMEVANASLYDGATALLEGVLMSARLQGLQGGRVLISEGTYPRVRALLRTYLEPLGFKLETWNADPKTFRASAAALQASEERVAAVVLQSPNQWGLVEDWGEAVAAAQLLKTKSVAYVTHAHSLALFASPGEAGADIAVGEGQTLGIPVGFGGPHLGLLACRKADVRQMPGRLVGATNDARGGRAFCVTLSTREQHIRREKATSNICSNQNLMATRATLYMTLMGPQGLRRVAELSRAKAYYARQSLNDAFQKEGRESRVLAGELLNEITILVPRGKALWADEALTQAEEQGLLAGVKTEVPNGAASSQGLTLAFTEKSAKKDIDRLVATLSTARRKT